MCDVSNGWQCEEDICDIIHDTCSLEQHFPSRLMLWTYRWLYDDGRDLQRQSGVSLHSQILPAGLPRPAIPVLRKIDTPLLPSRIPTSFESNVLPVPQRGILSPSL